MLNVPRAPLLPVSTPARAGLWDWSIAAILIADLFWTTLCLGGYLPGTMVVTAPLTAALLALHFARTAIEGRAWHPAGWFLVPFALYAAASAVWVAPARWLAWHDWLFWAHLIAVFWVAVNELGDPAVRRVVRNAILALSAVCALLALYQRIVNPAWLMLGRTQVPQFIGRAAGPFGAPNSLGALLLLVLPLTFLLAWKSRGRTRPIYIALAVLQSIALILTISRGAWIGLILTATAWPLLGPSTGRRGIARRALYSAAILAGAALAVGVMYSAMPTVRSRIDALVRDSGEKSRPILWRGAWNIFLEHRAFGSGGGSFNSLFEKFRPESFQDEPQWAHNDYLNTLSDYGLVGFTLFFGGAAAVATIAVRRGALARADPAARKRTTASDYVVQGLALGLAAFALQLFVDFHFKIPALGMLFATCAGLLVSRTWPRVSVAASASEPGSARSRSPLRVWAAALSLGVVVSAFLFVLPHYRGEALRYDLRRRVDRLARSPESREFERELIVRARAEFARATDVDPTNAQAWADRSYMTALWSLHESGQTTALGKEAEEYARMALNLAPVAHEFYFRLGVALDMQSKWPEAGEAFSRALKLAPSSSAAWYYQAYHFSLIPSFKGMALGAVATCLRLDPNNRQAEDLRRRLTVQSSR